MKSLLVTFVFVLLLGSETVHTEETVTGADLLLYDIKYNRETIVEHYRRNFEEAFNKQESDYSDDFKFLLAECSAELTVQELELMTAEEVRIYHSNPEINKAGSEKIVAKCYEWIVTELENVKSIGTQE